MLLNVAAHNVSIQNVKVSKHERHIMYSVTKRTTSQNVKCTLCNCCKTFYNGIRFLTLYVMWRLRFGTLKLCAATFCNIKSCDVYVMLLYVMWQHTVYSLPFLPKRQLGPEWKKMAVQGHFWVGVELCTCTYISVLKPNHERTISLGFLGIILRVLSLQVSVWMF